MKASRKFLALAALAVAGAASLHTSVAMADTVVQCNNISRPAGYLTVETDIPNPTCVTYKANKYQTPQNGLTIVYPAELPTLDAQFGVTSVTGTMYSPRYVIGQIVDKGVYCAYKMSSYNYVAVSNGYLGVCAGGSGVPNSVKMHKLLKAEVKGSAGSPAKLTINLNPAVSGTFNYAVRTTATLNGASTKVVKTGLTGNKGYTLSELAPTLVTKAQQGATFSFETEVFGGPNSMAMETVTATGAQLIGK
ncbi:hypothetical protein OS670_20065 [Pseudomonadaceae bacterium T75]|nr:hypothetical protein OS670_20065 [Pseudomonadaceae bacterium T75]